MEIIPVILSGGSGTRLWPLSRREHPKQYLPLANIIKNVVGYKGEIVFDLNRPDGAPRKLVDISILNALGWSHQVNLREGLIKTYEWYINEK